MSESTIAITGLLLFAYVVVFLASGAWVFRYGDNPPTWWVIVFAPLIGVLWLMVWVVFPKLFYDDERR